MLRAPENDMRNPIGLKLAGASLLAASLLVLAVSPALADKARKGAEDFGDQYITVPKTPARRSPVWCAPARTAIRSGCLTALGSSAPSPAP
jgi:hypothetical protein